MSIVIKEVVLYTGLVWMISQIFCHQVTKFKYRSSKFFPDFSCYDEFNTTRFEKIMDRCRLMKEDPFEDIEYFKCCILRVLGVFKVSPPKSLYGDAVLQIGGSSDNDLMVRDFTDILSGNKELAKNISKNVVYSCSEILFQNRDRICLYWSEIYECVFTAVTKYCPPPFIPPTSKKSRTAIRSRLLGSRIRKEN